jgi:hypothetical protein
LFYKIIRYSFFFLFFGLLKVNAQFYTIEGTVTNSAMEPVAFVEVSVIDNPTLNTKTDLKGQYSIQLTEGSYVLVFVMQGFKTLKIPVTVNYENVIQNIVLEPNTTDIKGFKIRAKKIDRSEEIIRNVIDGKYRYLYQDAYSVDAYIKATESETSKKEIPDSLKPKVPQLNFAEVSLTVHFSPPNKIKEERKGVDIRGQKSGLFFLTHTDGSFNFYSNLLEITALSESPILSPISNSGLIAYKFKMLKIYNEEGIRYYRIKVTPGLLGNALVEGELVIQDSTWRIKSLQLAFPKYHMVEYDNFEIIQNYTCNDSQYTLNYMAFNYEAKYGKSKSSGRTVVYYSNYKLKQEFKKRFFNNELSSTSKEAYERDSGYWQTLRLEPFTAEELSFLRQSDSLKALHSQKEWQDSIDHEFNRITLKKMFLTGQGNFKRKAERYWSFKPLIFVYTPVYLAGARISYWVSYQKIFKNKKEIDITPTVNFGLLNQDLKGSLNLYKLYNPFNRGSYNFSAGSDFGIINPYNSWIKTFSRENFYTHDFVNLYHRIELFNGFYLGTGLELANRRSISNLKFDSRGDDLWGGNTATTPFEGYQALYTNIALFYTPFQKYIREPYQKLILEVNGQKHL